MRFEVAFACLAAASYGQGPSYSDTCDTWGVLCDDDYMNTQGPCCDGMECQYDWAVYGTRCLEPWIPEPYFHIACGAWGHLCVPGDGLCCDGLSCYTHPDPEIAAKGYHMCVPLATTEIPQ